MPDLAGLRHAALSVTDVAGSARWYHDVLGFEEVLSESGDERRAVVMRLPGRGPVLAVVQHAGGEALAFDPRRTGLDHLAFAVDEREEMDVWAARLAERDVRYDGPHDIPAGAILNFKDPDGIALALFWAR